MVAVEKTGLRHDPKQSHGDLTVARSYLDVIVSNALDAIRR